MKFVDILTHITRLQILTLSHLLTVLERQLKSHLRIRDRRKELRMGLVLWCSQMSEEIIT
jgi:hypothetical protein